MFYLSQVTVFQDSQVSTNKLNCYYQIIGPLAPDQGAELDSRFFQNIQTVDHKNHFQRKESFKEGN